MNRVLAIMFLVALAVRGQPAASLPKPAPPPEAVSSELSPGAVLATMKKVADWQLAHPSASVLHYGPRDWTSGAFYAGVMALADIAGTPKYEEAMLALGRQVDWQPGPRVYHADDACVCQTWLELYLKERDPAMLAPTRSRFDFILEHPAGTRLDFKSKGALKRWSWCDSLFMAPPAWARLYKATGDRRYLDFMDKEWRATSAFLYDTNEHLFFRDSTYFEKREANGSKVFWSRGNGWVLAGLARVLEVMPADYPDRKFFEEQFKQMAARIAALQQPDGLWHSSLLDPEDYTEKETSGSGFYTFGLAWGINNGLLQRAQFEPVVRRAWTALVGCVTPEGKLQYVQPIGADPKKFDPSSNDVFGAGAFLLAGSEVYRLAGG